MALFATLAMRKMQLTQKQNENQWKQMQMCQKLQDLAFLGSALQDGVLSPDEIANLGGTDLDQGLMASMRMIGNAVAYSNTNISKIGIYLQGQMNINPDQFQNVNLADLMRNYQLSIFQQGIERQHRELEAKIKAEETKLQKQKTKIEIEGKAIDAELQAIDQGIDKGAKALAPKL